MSEKPCFAELNRRDAYKSLFLSLYLLSKGEGLPGGAGRMMLVRNQPY